MSAPMPIRTLSQVIETVAEATASIQAGAIEAAATLSRGLQGWIAGCDLDLRLRSDGRDRLYTIMVVAHERDDGHVPLAALLLSLDPERFQLVFVENADHPIFDLAGAEARRNVDLLHVGGNAGIGVARNLALRVATGAGVIVIDDDGLATAADIEALIATFERCDAVCVRGRVRNRSANAVVPMHYDVGSVLIPRPCDIEGFTIWRRADLERVGGFDPILYGHEGTELTARLYPSTGHEAFLYEPDAVLLHNYASDEARHAEKQARYHAITRYCIARSPGFELLMHRFRMGRDDPAMRAALHLRGRLVAKARTAGPLPVLVIVAVHDGPRDALVRFADDLNRQRTGGLRLILVDASGGDEAEGLLAGRLDPAIPRQVLRFAPTRRGEALNAALDIARREPGALCLLADVGETMIGQRARWTRAAHALFPDRSLIAFARFRLDRPLAIDGPVPFPGASLAALQLFGAEIPWSTLSFRPAHVDPRFDEARGPGLVEDWLERCLTRGRTGVFLPLGVAFQSADPADPAGDMGARLHAAIRRQGALLGSEAAVDVAALCQLAGWEIPADADAARATADYAWRLHDRMAGYGEEAPAVRAELLRRLASLDARQLAAERESTQQLRLDLERVEAESAERLRDGRQAQDEAVQLRAEFESATGEVARIRGQAAAMTSEPPASPALVTSMAGLVATHLEIRQEMAELRHRLLAGSIRERELTEREAQLRAELSATLDREKALAGQEAQLRADLSGSLALEREGTEREARIRAESLEANVRARESAEREARLRTELSETIAREEALAGQDVRLRGDLSEALARERQAAEREARRQAELSAFTVEVRSQREHLDAQQAELQERRAEVDTLRAELDRREASIEAIHASAGWRIGRRLEAAARHVARPFKGS